MTTFTLIAILAVLLAFAMWQFFKKQDPPPAAQKPREDLSSLKITQAKTGDSISIAGAGDDFTDLDFTVDRRSRYTAGPIESIELTGRYKERRIYLEVSDEDEIEVIGYLTAKKLTIDDIGLTEEDLAAMDERQNTADFFEYDGKNWLYSFSKEITLYRESSMEGATFYCWQFNEQEGDRVLNIEKWESEPFAVSMGRVLNPADITVYRGA